MANAYITGVSREGDDSLTALVCVQSDADPLNFTNYRVPLDPTWTTLTRQQKIDQVMAAVRAQRQAVQPSVDTSFVAQGQV